MDVGLVKGVGSLYSEVSRVFAFLPQVRIEASPDKGGSFEIHLWHLF